MMTTMTSATTSTTETTTGTTTGGPRSDAFARAVVDKKLRGDSRDGAARVVGLVMMIVGVVGAFLAYQTSLSQDDLRDISSFQVLATAFVGLTVLGAGLYVAAALARVLRLWLLRQLVESQDRMDQLVAALGKDTDRA